jgi:hypothetical protein
MNDFGLAPTKVFALVTPSSDHPCEPQVFTDIRHGIKAVLRFGPNKGSRYHTLRRPDAIMGEIYDAGTPLPLSPVQVRSGCERKREFVTSNDKPRIVAYRYIIEASIDVS